MNWAAFPVVSWMRSQIVVIPLLRCWSFSSMAVNLSPRFMQARGQDISPAKGSRICCPVMAICFRMKFQASAGFANGLSYSSRSTEPSARKKFVRAGSTKVALGDLRQTSANSVDLVQLNCGTEFLQRWVLHQTSGQRCTLKPALVAQ